VNVPSVVTKVETAAVAVSISAPMAAQPKVYHANYGSAKAVNTEYLNFEKNSKKYINSRDTIQFYKQLGILVG
jgi:hypothetical protein